MKDMGRYIWFDLATTELTNAQSFYKECIGWTTMPWGEGDKPYTMFSTSEGPVGGSVELPDELRTRGVPPHWIAYVKVSNVDATVARAKELGGAILREGLDIPKVGRIAVLADPQGAAFSVFQPLEDRPTKNGPPQVGDMTWAELHTSDWESAWAFYAELLGWKEIQRAEMGPEIGTYLMFTSEGMQGPMGGMSNSAKKMGGSPNWLYYFHVGDMGAALKRIADGGGEVLSGPMKVPGGDRVAHCLDPQGAAFAIHASAS